MKFCFENIKNNEIIKSLFAGDSFIAGMHLRKAGFKNNVCVLVTNIKNKNSKKE